MSSSDEEFDFQKLEFQTLPPEEMARRASEFQKLMARRRSVREFAERPVSAEIIRTCIRCAGSGANRRPWHFAVVTDPVIKKRIREGAEAEEKAFFGRRAPDEWLQVLAPLGTDANNPFLEKTRGRPRVFYSSD